MTRLGRAFPEIASPCTCAECHALDLEFPDEGRQLVLTVARAPDAHTPIARLPVSLGRRSDPAPTAALWSAPGHESPVHRTPSIHRRTPMTFTTMTIGDLCVSPFNARKNQIDANAIDGMAESLLSRGQIFPLVVHPMIGEDNRWGAFAGGRRYRAFRKLIDDGRLPADHPIEVIVRDIVDEGELIDLSVAENLVRLNLRPYETYAAVARANLCGRTAQEIAETNGQPVQTIHRWIALGNIEQMIFKALEDEQINSRQAEAFAATQDHALQLHAFHQIMQLPMESRRPDVIRRLLKVGDSEATRLLRFVGEQAYRDAGGRYELDLFAEAAEERGRVVDEGLLMQLVETKLEATREQLRRQAGRPLRFEKDYPRDGPHGPLLRDLEIHAEPQPRSAADARAIERLEKEMAGLEEKADQLLDQADTPKRTAAIAAIEIDYEPMERDLEKIRARRRIILPDGDIFGTLVIEEDGALEIRWWWGSRKEKRAAEKPAPAKPVSAGPIGAAATLAAAKGLRPPPVVDGAAIDGSSTNYRDRPLADAAIKLDHGLTQDGVQIMRTLRREVLRAAMLADAEDGGAVGHDYLIWQLAREQLVGGYASQRGANGVGRERGDLPTPEALMHVQRTEARRVWKDALTWLKAHPSMDGEADMVDAFRVFQSESEQFKAMVATIVAGLTLVRSANADGYRVALHDHIAACCGFGGDEQVRTLVDPTEEMVALLPKAQRLQYAQPHVDGPSFRTWDKLKAGELVAPVTRALKRAKGWVHPLLRFDPPPARGAAPAGKPESQIEEAGR
jgi:ParB family chromosome partitioning protein